MTATLWDRLATCTARFNGLSPGDLAESAERPRDRGGRDLSGAVVVVRADDSTSAMGTVFRAWQLGAVPLLTHRSLPGVPGWNEVPGSYVLHDQARAWGLPVDCALLQVTSGSTGAPRLAMRSEQSLLWEARGYAGAFPRDRGTVVHCVGVGHSLGSGLTLGALLAGRDVLHEAPARAARLGPAVAADDGCSVVAGSPSTLRLLLHAFPSVAGAPELLFCGAGSLEQGTRRDIARRWPRVDVAVGFGSTETGAVLAGRSGIGRPVDGVSLLGGAAPGEVVPLHLRLPCPVLGYVGGGPAGRTWTFPDLVRVRRDGELEHVARVSRSMRRREQTQALADLSGHLERMGRDWRVVEEPASDASPRPVLVVEGPELSIAELSLLRDAAGELLGGFPVVRVVREFPRDPLGKVRLADLFAAGGTPRRERHGVVT